MDGEADGRIKRQMERRPDGRTGGRMNGWMDWTVHTLFWAMAPMGMISYRTLGRISGHLYTHPPSKVMEGAGKAWESYSGFQKILDWLERRLGRPERMPHRQLGYTL